jgi:hypothetical protein
MKRFKTRQVYVAVAMLILGVWFITGCGSSDEAALVRALGDNVVPGTCTEAGPKVLSSNPTNNDEGVSRSKVITVNFSEAMDPTTIAVTNSTNPEVLTFTLRDNNEGANTKGTVAMSLSNTVATFTPDAALNGDSWYTAIITKYAKNAGGTSLGCSYKWEFKTGTSTTAGQAPVNLGTAGTYGIFASNASVTLAVNSLVNGNVGLNPAAACNNCVVGTTVKNGVINNGGALAVKAQTDFQTAYAEASIRATGACSLSSPSDISAAQAACNGFTPGPTYRAGLYRASDTIGFTGTITLDAQGDASAVFIFQTDVALVTGSNSVVVLANQAKAKNVFWIVGSAATLGVSSTFKGTVIAHSAAISVLNGVNPSPLTDVEGRLFAGAAVTVNQFATVTVPLP